MMSAIMRGLKQKLEEEMARSQQTLEAQSHQIIQKDARLEALEAKIQKQKFKKVETKKVMGAQTQQMNEL